MPLGKITSIKLGFGGYQDAMFGVTIGLGGDGWGVTDFKGYWARSTDGAKWTLEDQAKIFARTMEFVVLLLEQSKKTELSQLKGVPVEVFFDGKQCLRDWRVLKEVI